MGTSVSNLQILGASLDDVRAALPHTLAGQWSERFVTACPDLAFQTLERKAGVLSKKLARTVLAVSMFDGDTLSLAVFREGKRITRHTVNPETGDCTVGNPKAFCAALGLSEELAPKLRRLFTDCPMQEDKLGILQALLGAPLFVRCSDEDDGYLPEEPAKADSGPLDEWVREHPAPPKIKNQGKAELIQEIPEKVWSYSYHQSNIPILRSPRRIDEEDFEIFGSAFKLGDVIGECDDGRWAHPLSDGQLELIPLPTPEISPELYRAFLHKEPPDSDYVYLNYDYTHLNGRMVTTTALNERDPNFDATHPVQTVILHDTAGILPCPLPLTIEGAPALLAPSYPPNSFYFLPDGGFLAAISPLKDNSRPPVQIREPALVRYGPDGAERWTHWGIDYVVQAAGEQIYALIPERGDEPKRLLALGMDGSVTAECPVPFSPYSTLVCLIGGVPCFLEPLDYQKDALLHRLTPDLRPDGEVLVPYMSSLALSPDGSLLYAAGYESGLRVIDAASLNIIRDLPKRANLHTAIADCQNRLWVGNGGYFECYTPDLEMISRHRLAGDLCQVYRNDAGQVCALTFQQKKYIIRVYRFS